MKNCPGPLPILAMSPLPMNERLLNVTGEGHLPGKNPGACLWKETVITREEW